MQNPQLRRKVKIPEMGWQSGRKITALFTVAVFAVLSMPVMADEIHSTCPKDDAASSLPINQVADQLTQLTKSKLKLLDKIVHDSSTAQRIEESKNNEAIELLKAARQHFAEAKKLFDQGCVKASEKQLNDGLQTIEIASHDVVDSQRLDKVARQRYKLLSGQATSLREAYDLIMQEKDNTAVNILDERSLQELLHSSAELAQKNNYTEANKTMLKATNMLEVSLTIVRDKETLVHTLKFDSIEEEYAYVLEINNSYMKLLQLIMGNQNTSDPKHVSMEKLVERNKSLLAVADINISKGNMEEALANLEEGTENLIRALRIAGIGL